MKVSLNSIKSLNQRYSTTGDISAIGIDRLIDKIGSQLAAIEGSARIGEKYKDILVVKVVSVEPHPNADKLKVCKIDDKGVVKDVQRDSNGHVQVVCGAPNVYQGMMAAWVPVGAIVPASSAKEPLVVEAREIRGVISNGMLASAKELALGDSHEGLLELDKDLSPGTDFGAAMGLKDDVVLDLENKMFTHRPDCFGFLGIARELSGIQGMPYKSPDWYQTRPILPAPEEIDLSLDINNELPRQVLRFTAAAMSSVKVGPSPAWLQVELAKVDLRPINNIVDLTNYLMLMSGQPLHAYDYDKVKALSGAESATIVVRNPKPGEKLTLLNGKTITPRPDAIMIATDNQLIGVGGIMGGNETEVDESTKNIIIECANFDMYSIRRTSMTHGLFTDAVTRFTKGQSPLQNLAVLVKMVNYVHEIAGGKLSSPFIDQTNLDKTVLERTSLYPPVTVSTDFINTRLGLHLSAEEMKTLLQNVEFVVNVNGEDLVVKAPFWRTDIELREDVVEEIGRLYGYDKLPLSLPSRDLTPASKNPLLSAKAEIRSRLSRAGANEVLTYSFVHGDLLGKVGQDKNKAWQVANALSPQLQYYRLSLVPSLLEKVHPNIKTGYNQFALFELGKTHSVDQVDDEGLPGEFEFTALVVAAADKLKTPGSAYYLARKYLVNLLGVELSFKPIGEDMKQYPVVRPYDQNRSALVSIKSTNEFLGIVGEFRPSVSRGLKLPKYTAGFEVDTEVLMNTLNQAGNYRPLPRFPKLIQDITLKVPAGVSYQEVYNTLSEEILATKPKNTLAELFALDIFQNPENKEHKNITLRLNIASYERTLTDTEVNKLLDKVALSAKDKLGAERL